MGLTPLYFNSILYKEYFWIVSGYWMKQEREWERTRLIVAALTGQYPVEIIRLSCDTPLLDWEEDDNKDKARHAINLWK